MELNVETALAIVAQAAEASNLPKSGHIQVEQALGVLRSALISAQPDEERLEAVEEPKGPKHA